MSEFDGSSPSSAVCTGPVVIAAIVSCLLLGITVGAALATEPEEVAGVELYRGTDETFDDARSVEAAIENGRLAPAERAVPGDTLVVAIDSRRLAATLEQAEGSTTDRFLAALEGDAEFRFAQKNPSPDRAMKVAHVDPYDLTAYRMGSTTYVLVDPGNLTYQRYRSEENDPATIRNGDRFAAVFGYDLDEYETDGPEVELYTARSEIRWTSDGAPLPTEPFSRTVLVNLAPDDGLVARLTLQDGSTQTEPVDVGDTPGRTNVRFDLSNGDRDSTYTLELHHDGRIVDRYEGTVRTPEATVAEATLIEGADGPLVDATVNLSHGGSIEVQNDAGERIGWTGIDAEGSRIEPGEATTVTIELHGDAAEVLTVRAVREDVADADYYGDSGAVAEIDLGDRTIGSPTPSNPGDGSDSNASDSTPGPDGTVLDATPAPDGDERGSGFTAVAFLVAVVSFVVARIWQS